MPASKVYDGTLYFLLSIEHDATTQKSGKKVPLKVQHLEPNQQLSPICIASYALWRSFVNWFSTQDSLWKSVSTIKFSKPILTSLAKSIL